MDERERRSRGMKVRREVLGDAHVDRAQARRNDFNAEFQDLITRHAWGELWTRKGLPRKTRSLITLAMLVALGRREELQLHVRGALNNGVTRDEIQEVLLHAAVYCGLPAAHAAFHAAEEILGEFRSGARAPAAPRPRAAPRTRSRALADPSRRRPARRR
jgi:4-carboxymuconolactone decarboxylase